MNIIKKIKNKSNISPTYHRKYISKVYVPDSTDLSFRQTGKTKTATIINFNFPQEKEIKLSEQDQKTFEKLLTYLAS